MKTHLILGCMSLKCQGALCEDPKSVNNERPKAVFWEEKFFLSSLSDYLFYMSCRSIRC